MTTMHWVIALDLLAAFITAITAATGYTPLWVSVVLAIIGEALAILPPIIGK